MAFQLNTAGIPADDSFWYRMALLDVQQALINSTTVENAKEFDQIFDGLKGAWEELFEKQREARIAKEQLV